MLSSEEMIEDLEQIAALVSRSLAIWTVLTPDRRRYGGS
jgi:hypothetical protein